MEKTINPNIFSKKLIIIFQWIVSIICILIGLMVMIAEAIPGFMILLIGIVIFPPLDRILSEKYKILHIKPIITKIIIIVILTLHIPVKPATRSGAKFTTFKNFSMHKTVIYLVAGFVQNYFS